MTLKNNRAPLLGYFKLYASFHSNLCIQTGVTVLKCPIWVKMNAFLAVWPWNLRRPWKNKRAPLITYFKLCASFRSHMWIQTGVTVRKPLNWVLTSLTLTSCMDIAFINGNNSCNFMIFWQEHSGKGVTDRQTDRQKEVFLRAARSQLKMDITELHDSQYL